MQLEAAGGVVKNSDGNILMIYRDKIWDLPKGKREQGEDIETCAVREVMEECGIEELSIEELRTKTYHIYPYKGVWHLKQTWWYNMVSNYSARFTPQIEEGITKVEWVTPQLMEKKLSNSYLTICEVINQ